MSMSVADSATVRSGFPRPFPNGPENVLEQFNLSGKVTVVTGAADGIGLAVAEAMTEAKASAVAMWYNSNEAAVQRAKELEAAHPGVKVKAYKVNVSDAEAVEAVISQVVSDFGRLDVFVANAGMAISKPILEQTLDEYKKQMSVNGKTSRGGHSGITLCSKLLLMCHQSMASFIAPSTRGQFSSPRGMAASSSHPV